MAYRQKRRNARRKKSSTRPRRKYRSRVRQPVQFFKRSTYLSGIVTATSTADIYGTQVFSISQVPNVAEFTTLYDQYKINLVKWQLIPRGNQSDVGTSTTTGQLMGVFSALDYDDNSAPTSIQDIMEYQNARMTRSNQIHKRVLKPRARVNIVGSGGAGVNGQIFGSRNPWIDCNAPTTPHFGIKYVLQQLPAGTQIYDMKIDFYMAFKNVR